MTGRAKAFLFVSFVALTAFVIVGFVTSSPSDWPFASATSMRDVDNLSGPLGSAIAFVSFDTLGRLFAWLLPLALLLVAGGIISTRSLFVSKMLGKGALVVVLLTTFFSLIPVTEASVALTGSIGRGVAGALSSVIGSIGAAILVITCFMLIMLTEVRYAGGAGMSVARRLGGLREGAANLVQRGVAWGGAWRERRAHRDEPPPVERPIAADPPPLPDPIMPEGFPDESPWQAPAFDPVAEAKSAARTIPLKPPIAHKSKRAANGTDIDKADLPPITMLAAGRAQSQGYSSEQLRSWSDVLEAKLANYGISGQVTAVNQGPLVTTFEFEPAPGVKIKDIVSRADDLALAMRARSLRLIAPIPGRAVVGIEIPNPEQSVVYFRDVLEEVPERLRYSGLMIAIGVDAVGKPFHINLCTAPHLLMAGTTGAGKSVSLNCFLASLLFQYRPSDVGLLLIDPKMVEMSMYNGIPHLLHPVITDPKEAVRVFHYAIREMERRNRLLHKHGVKNIASFNSKIAMGKLVDDEGEAVERLPYIVLVVDELADLVLTKGVDFESLLSRLSNMARAVGIHMIVATQRPSVDVIDGKTKANFPTRVAFRVPTKVDSRTILDVMGAEKLLGRGDMLYVDNKHPEPLRMHGAWISEDELEALVDHWKQYEFDESELNLVEDTPAGPGGDPSERDPFFEQAKGVIIQYKQGSTSLLQRKLHVGYARAARLLDQLELAGYVGPPDGSKPREVFSPPDEELPLEQ